MRGLPPLPLSSHLNYKKDDPGASGCVALRCAARRRNPARFGEREEETFLEGAGEKGKRWRTFWVSVLGEVL